MAVNAIPVDQRVIDIDSRLFASIEKALVERITNSDDSYARLEAAGVAVSGQILVQYERHRRGALLAVTDHAQGMSFAAACSILSYGGAHSPLAQGTGGGRGYFGRVSSRRSSALATAGCRGSNCSAPRTAAISTMTVARIAR